MTTFTVHLPNAAMIARYDRASTPYGASSALAHAVFVPERFSWGAFIFGPLWLLSCGLWLTFFVWVVLIIALLILGGGLLSSSAAFWIFVAIEFFLGLEGNSMRRRKLERRGFHGVEVISSLSREEAEKTFFSRWGEGEDGADAPRPAHALPGSDPHGDVLGHFPLPGGRG
jgi:hypothetical protein